jgi:hypothetical protein
MLGSTPEPSLFRVIHASSGPTKIQILSQSHFNKHKKGPIVHHEIDLTIATGIIARDAY